jgi:hypothetical protein
MVRNSFKKSDTMFWNIPYPVVTFAHRVGSLRHEEKFCRMSRALYTGLQVLRIPLVASRNEEVFFVLFCRTYVWTAVTARTNGTSFRSLSRSGSVEIRVHGSPCKSTYISPFSPDTVLRLFPWRLKAYSQNLRETRSVPGRNLTNQ